MSRTLEQAIGYVGGEAPPIGQLEENKRYETSNGVRVIFGFPYHFATSGGGVRANYVDAMSDTIRENMSTEAERLASEMAVKGYFLESCGAKGEYAVEGSRDDFLANLLAARSYVTDLVALGWNKDYFQTGEGRRDVLAPDSGTADQMGTMVHAIASETATKYGRSEKEAYLLACSIVSAKPRNLGGIPDIREPATGYILRYTTDLLIERGETELEFSKGEPVRTVVHGLGAVGLNYIRTEYDSIGRQMISPASGDMKLVGISDIYGTVESPGGIDPRVVSSIHAQLSRVFWDQNISEGRKIKEIDSLIRKHLDESARFIPGFGQDADTSYFLSVGADVLALCATPRGVVNNENVGRLLDNPDGPKVITEGANHPILDEAETAILGTEGIMIIPGEEANRGGRACSSAEVEGKINGKTSAQDAFSHLKEAQQKSVREVSEFQKRRLGGTTNRRAALYALGILKAVAKTN